MKLTAGEHCFDGDAKISSDLSQQRWGDVAASMERDCCSSTVWMTELFVGTTLTDLNEPQVLEDLYDFEGGQDWDIAQLTPPRSVAFRRTKKL